MVQVYDNIFADDFLLELHKQCLTLPWQFTNKANRSQYPSNSILGAGSHSFFGTCLYSQRGKNRYFDVTPDIIFDAFYYITENVIDTGGEVLELHKIETNLQVYGQDGTAHKDDYTGEGTDRTILLYPHYKWEYDWGGSLEVLDNNLNIINSYLPLPGRVLYFDSTVPHRGLAPAVKNIARMSIAFRLNTRSN